MFSFKIDFL